MSFIEHAQNVPHLVAAFLDGLHPFHAYVTTPMVLFWGFYWSLAAVYAFLDFHLASSGRLGNLKRQSDRFASDSFRYDPRAYARTALGSFRNQLIVSLPLSILMMPLWQWRGVTYRAPFPDLWTATWQLAVVILVQEVGFYYAHRFLHRPYWFRKIHYMHHRWKSPIACSAHYAHPLEHLVANSLPFLAGPLLVGLHFQLFLVWFALGTIVVVRSHSGYAGHLGSEEHDRHHQSFACNYGIMMWWDRLHRTQWKGVSERARV